MKKAFTAIIAVFAMAALSAGLAWADSMLTSPPADKSDGLLIVGEENFERFSTDESESEVMYITLKGKMEKIWGPDVVREKMAVVDEVDNSDIPSHLPRIMVRKKVYGASRTAYKYRHKYSSRSRGPAAGGNSARAEYINITPIIVRESRRYGISPVLLKAVIQTESNYNNYAVSCAGAMGLGQLMPGTARYLGCRDPYNPELNIRAAAKYLSMLKKMFRSTDLVLAAYNAGPGTVSRSGNRIPNIYETRRYVQKVKGNMHWRN